MFTGRRDSLVSFSEVASYDLPSPQADLSETLASFASRGFDLRETVTLLGMILQVSYIYIYIFLYHHKVHTRVRDVNLDRDIWFWAEFKLYFPVLIFLL